MILKKQKVTVVRTAAATQGWKGRLFVCLFVEKSLVPLQDSSTDEDSME